MTPHDSLQQLRDLDRESPRFYEELNNFLRGSAYQTVFPDLQSESLAWLVEYLDNVLASAADRAGFAFQGSLQELRNICGVKEVLPESCMLPESLLGCLDEGSLGDSRLRIRYVKVRPGGDPQKAKETFHQVVVTAKHLTHPNLVPLMGVTVEPPQLISDRMPGGNLLVYLRNHPDADRISLLSGVADGLNYLHSCNVIHGDLNGSNILVDGTDHARITDFGLAMITQDLDSIRGSLAEHDQGALWVAPEILGNRGTYSKEADVFSFAGVAIEAFTGATPFHDKSPGATISAITEGDRPPRPTHPSLTDSLWSLIQRCWDEDAHLRPHALRISCGFGIPAWKRLVDYSLTSDERISLIMVIFSDRSEIEVVGRLCGDDAQSFVDIMDQMLDSLGPRLRKKSLSALCRICGRQALLPRSLQLPLCYDRSGEALYSGGYADVWMGEYQGHKVAVKVLKVYTTSNLYRITSRFCKEVMTWKSLDHPNVLPLLGVTMGSKHFAMVSEWMINGNINEFISANWDVNRFNLLKDVAKGLIYMHSQGMVHGDLKGANIVIDQNERARLADFGLLTFASDPTNTMTSGSVVSAGTTRWMSPELLYPEKFGSEKGGPTKQSDYYALGMVILEVLGGEPPFARDKDLIVMRKVIDGERPERPDVVWFTDDIWRTLERCWSPHPNERPTTDTVLECLTRVSKIWQPVPPITGCARWGSDWEVSTMSDHSISLPPSRPGSEISIVSRPRSIEVRAGETESSDEGSPVVPPRPYLWSTDEVPPNRFIHRLPESDSDDGPIVMPAPPPSFAPIIVPPPGVIRRSSPTESSPLSSLFGSVHSSQQRTPSTIRGWLTKMRGTLVDNEAIRSRGIKEMKQATVARLRRRKEEADRELRNLARIGTGKSPLKQSIKQPWPRLSFLRSRSEPIAGGSGRPVATTRESPPVRMQERSPSSSTRYSSISGSIASTNLPPTGG